MFTQTDPDFSDVHSVTHHVLGFLEVICIAACVKTISVAADKAVFLFLYVSFVLIMLTVLISNEAELCTLL